MKEIKKNSQEIIRIENKEYKGNKFLDCRVYFLDKETQEYRPTKKGISLVPVLDSLNAWALNYIN